MKEERVLTLDNYEYGVVVNALNELRNDLIKDDKPTDAGSLVILKNPVEFGHKENDPVRIVAAVAVKENTDSINTIFSIMNTLCNSVAVNKLLKAKSEEEILEIIRYYENRVQ